MPEITPHQQIELRSHEVQEIISQVPSGIIRWGMTVLFSVMFMLLMITWFIEYPDVLQAKVIITTSVPPVTMVSRANGNLVLLKKEKQFVKEGELIAYLRSSANPQSVIDVEKNVTNGNFISLSKNSLGELEPAYGAMQKAAYELQLFHETVFYDKQIKQLQQQKTTYLKLQNTLARQLQLARQELILAKEKFKMDSALYIQKVTATVDFNKDRTVWLQQQRAFSNTETSLISNEVQINQLSKQISDLEIQKQEKKQQLELALENSKNNLLAQIAKWKETYLFVASTEGKIAFIGVKETEMYVDAGKPLISILPFSDTLIARAELPLHNSGKVKEGQRVNIRLENYPFEEYGTISGLVSSISSIPNEDKYFINITLPNKLRTNQNKTLEFRQQLSGTTEIITEELKLMERFFYQFRKLINAR